MSDNPSQTPADHALPAGRPSFRLHWYHVPFIIAVVCGVALAVTARATSANMKVFVPCSAILCAILIFDLVACAYVIMEWRRTGKPPSFTDQFLVYFGFLEAPQTRAMWRLWRERPQLGDDEFYDLFYTNSGIAKEVVTAVRREWLSIFGKEAMGTYPSYDLETAAPELDFADVFYRFEKDLHVVIPWRTAKVDFDFRFDSLVRLVADCKANRYPVPLPADRQHARVRIRHLPFIIAGVCIIVLAITSNMTHIETTGVMIGIVIPAIILVIDLPLCMWLWQRGYE